MTQMFFNPGHDRGENLFNGACIPELPAVRMRATRTPRSARREYSDSELSTAATMLQRLRDRRDVIDHLRQLPEPTPADQQTTVNAVVEKLLDIL